MPHCRLRYFSVLIAFMGALGAAPAGAACWAMATGINFGVYDPQASGPSAGAGNITLECDRREPSATISVGTGNSGSFVSRSMFNGADALQYNAFTSAARTQVWGDGSSGTGNIQVSPFPNRPISLAIYGQIPPGQNVRAGTYADTLIVTIEY